MASKRRNRRRRRGRASFPLRLLCLAVVIAAFLGALTMFFRIDMIVVEGNERYTEEQIIEAAGVQKEQNLVLLNKYKVKQSIFDTLPYVETVVINRKYPDALILTVTECTASAALTGENDTWLMSDEGKILERAAQIPEGCARVTGCTLVEPAVGAMAAFADEDSYKFERLLTLLRAAEETGCIVTAENHQVGCGLGSAITNLTSAKNPVPVERIGIRNRFGQVGPQDFLMQQYNLTAEDITAAALRAIARK